MVSFVIDESFDLSLLNDMHPPPLEVEPEAHEGAFRVLDTWNELASDGTLTVTHHHTNFFRAKAGKMPFRNIPHFPTHAPARQKRGLITGAFHRVVRATPAPAHRGVARDRVASEFIGLGMPAATVFALRAAAVQAY